MVRSLESGSYNDNRLILSVRLIRVSFEDPNVICLMVENFIFRIFPFPVKIAGKYTHITLATQYTYT